MVLKAAYSPRHTEITKPGYPRGQTPSILHFDHSPWQPGGYEQAKSRLNRKGRRPKAKPRVKIVKRGLGYTRARLHEPVPRAWVFRTQRAAKKFFNQPAVMVHSVEQINSMFGSPTGRLNEKQPDSQDYPRP